MKSATRLWKPRMKFSTKTKLMTSSPILPAPSNFMCEKAAHMTEYCLLAIAISFPLYVYGVRGIWLILLAGAICVGFAGFDEYHQSFVADRGPSVRDVGIDSIGVTAGILLVQAFCWSTLHNPSGKRRRRKRR